MAYKFPVAVKAKLMLTGVYYLHYLLYIRATTCGVNETARQVLNV